MADVVDPLRERYQAMSFGDARIFFVLGHPRAGLGKGHLVARLASLVDGTASAVKYEGMLNTNDRNNHPSPTDDIATYASFNPGIVMGWPNQILGGEVIRDFINTYGGTDREHLMFVPHLSQHLALHLHAAWQACGSPATLFVEIGGTLTDPELTGFVLPCVSQLKTRHRQVGVLLLTELPYDGPEFRTRPLRQALRDAQSSGLTFDVVFLRLPAGASSHDIATVPADIEARIRELCIYGGESPAIVPVPHFATEGLQGYRDHLARHLHVLPYGTGPAPAPQPHSVVAHG
jgi:hypothetical protein